MNNYPRLMFLAVLLLATLSSCTSMQNIDPHDVGDLRDDHSIVVFSIPDTHRIIIHSGFQRNGSWKASRPALDANHKPENQYIVARLRSKEGLSAYGIERFYKLYDHGNGFRVCKGRNTLTFKVPNNQVIYVGHFVLNTAGDTTVLDINMKYEEAQLHLKQHYPKIADKLIQAETLTQPLDNISCNFGWTDFLHALSISLASVSFLAY